VANCVTDQLASEHRAVDSAAATTRARSTAVITKLRAVSCADSVSHYSDIILSDSLSSLQTLAEQRLYRTYESIGLHTDRNMIMLA